MDFYCDVCDKNIIPQNKCRLFESNIHKEFDECKHMDLTIENLDINNVDELFYAYIIQNNKQYDYYINKCHLKLVFNVIQYSTCVKSNFFDNKTMVSCQNFLEKLIDDFKNERYNFNLFDEVTIITIANKMDMSYDFYIKLNMHAIERKLTTMNNKNKKLTTSFNRNWRHPWERKFKKYRV